MARKNGPKTFTNGRLLVTILVCFPLSRGQNDRSVFESTTTKCRTVAVPIIETRYGELQGKTVDFSHEEEKLCPVAQFLGIPYAKPPIGDLRWKRPVSPEPWSDHVRHAFNFGHVCPQKRNGSFPNALLPIWFDDSATYIQKKTMNMSEDCLYLNIYVPLEFYANETRAPDTYKTRLPVMVYIHGHTFMEGSGNFYDGSALASYGKVIVVTINYRLGVLGFLSTLGDESPGNYGLWDQIKALEWIADNIQAFGGDPRKVTLFGSGSGAASINLLMVTVQVEDIFQRVILQSGTALSSWTIVKNPVSQSRLLSQHQDINCDNPSKRDMMTCLRKKTWRQLIAADVQPEIYTLDFGPVVDGKLIQNMPDQRIADGEYINYPMIIGVSQGDGYGFVHKRGTRPEDIARTAYEKHNFQLDVDKFVDGFYWDAGEGRGILKKIIEYMYTDWKNGPTSSTFRRSLLNLYTDRQWLEPSIRTARMHLDYAYPAYFYTLFHRAGKSKTTPEWMEAGHGDELPFVFGYPFLPKIDSLFQYNFTREDRMVSVGIMTYWTNFAKTGNPMQGDPQKTNFLAGFPNYFDDVSWPKYDKTQQRSLEISIKPTIREYYRTNQVAFWSSFFPKLIKESDRVFPFSRTTTLPNPPKASGNSPIRITKSTPTWTPKPGLTSTTPSGISAGSGKADGGMSLQLTITLAIGFVLLFVNIIAFSVVSYHKEKDKFKIERLQAQLEEKKRLFTEQLKRHGIDNGRGSHDIAEESMVKCHSVEQEIQHSKAPEKSHVSTPYTSSSGCTNIKPPLRAVSTTALPQLKPCCVYRDDSLTSTSAEEHSRTTGRRNTFKKYGTYHSSLDCSPASMVVANSREELPCAQAVIPEIGREDFSTTNGGRYSLQTTSSITPDHKYKTYNGKLAVPGAVRMNVTEPCYNDENRPTSLWSVVSSVAPGRPGPYHKLGHDANMMSHVDMTQSKMSSTSALPEKGNVYAVHPEQGHGEIGGVVVQEGGYLARDLSCGSKSALLGSPVDKSCFRSDTSESETDRTASSSRSDAVGSYCVTNNKTMNVITKL